MRRITTIGGAMSIALALSSYAGADENNRLTHMTFSGPVQVPGATLSAGTYTFKLADTTSARHVVQIFNKDDNRLITTAMTIASERHEPANDTLVTFSEAPAGTPQPVKAWYYPGNSIGEEFLYSASQAQLVARAEPASPPTVEEPRQTERESERRGATTIASVRNSRSARQAQSSSSRSSAEQQPPASDRAATPAADNSLPRTASPLPLVALLTVLSFTVAFGVRRLRHRQ